MQLFAFRILVQEVSSKQLYVLSYFGYGVWLPRKRKKMEEKMKD